jgi:O-antigen/teichoic acid export membrane protein
MMARIRQLIFGRFARDAAATQVSLVVSAACGLGTSVILARGLGQAEYGRYALVFALYGLVNILGDVGIGKASITRLAEARGSDDADALTEQAAYLLKMTVVISVAVTAVGLIFAPSLGRLLNPGFRLGPYVRVLFLTSVAGIGRGFAAPLLTGMRRMRSAATIEISFAVLRVAAVGAAIVAGLGLWGVVGAHITATLAVSVVGLAVCRRTIAGVEALPSLGELAGKAVHVPWWDTFKFGARVTFDRQMSKLIELLPVLVLGRLGASPRPAGFFNLGRNIVRNLGLLLLGVSRNLLPFFAELKGKRHFARMRRDYWRAAVAGGAGAIAVTAVCVPFLPAALAFVYGADWVHATAAVAYVLLAKLVVEGFGIGLGAFIVVTDRVWWLARLKLVSLPLGVGALIGAALLGQAYWHDPLVGVAVGAAAAYAAWWMALALIQLVESFRVLNVLAAEDAGVDLDQSEPGS